MPTYFSPTMYLLMISKSLFFLDLLECVYEVTRYTLWSWQQSLKFSTNTCCYSITPVIGQFLHILSECHHKKFWYCIKVSFMHIQSLTSFICCNRKWSLSAVTNAVYLLQYRNWSSGTHLTALRPPDKRNFKLCGVTPGSIKKGAILSPQLPTTSICSSNCACSALLSHPLSLQITIIACRQLVTYIE